MRPACGRRRRAFGFVPTNLLTVCWRTTVGVKFAARRRKPHAAGVRSPFSTKSLAWIVRILAVDFAIDCPDTLSIKIYMNSLAKYLLHLLALSSFVSPLAAGDWPQWRGADRTDVSRETGLMKSWPKDGPKRLWLYDKAGNGYSGPAIGDGRFYTLGTREESECLLALDADTGKELWAVKLGEALENRWGGGPRGTPALDGDRVYALTGPGLLSCLARADGKILWQKKMSELGGAVPSWGYTESVLIDGEKVVCTPGGSKGTMAALDKKSGELLWQTKEFTDLAQYASIVSAEIHGVRQYIQLTMMNLFGVDAKTGKVLWKSPWQGRTAVIPTPIVRDDYVYISAGYGVGSKLVKIGKDNAVSVVYENRVMKNHHGGVILLGDYLYGHSDGVGWVCQNFLTGEEVWSERAALGKGATGSSAEGMLYCVDEGSGAVALVEASPKGWKEISRFKLDPQTKIRSPQGRIWTHPVVSNGKLYLRDQDLIYCYDIKEK